MIPFGALDLRTDQSTKFVCMHYLPVEVIILFADLV